MDERRLIHTVTWEAAVRLGQAQSALRNMRISIDTNILFSNILFSTILNSNSTPYKAY